MKCKDEYISMIAEHAERLYHKVKRHRDGAITIWPGIVGRKGKLIECGRPGYLKGKK